MNDLTVYAPGSYVVFVGLGSKGEAKVIQVSIGDSSHVRYEVVFWTNGERKTAWVEEFELDESTDGGSTERIGFHAPS